MNQTFELKILNSKIKDEYMPSYATEGSAGLDLRACLEEPLVLEPNATHLVSTGIAIYIEDTKLAGLILPRSGLGHKYGIVLGNLSGLIDADYQGELKISCWNRSDKIYTVQPMDRIAQLVILPVVQAQFKLVDSFSPTARGEGGYGHSGN